MELLKERRIAKRCNTFWLVFNNTNNSFLGYITDLSVSGLNIWLLKNYSSYKTFSIKIKPLKLTRQSVLDFNIKIVWTEKNSNHSVLEAGAEFTDLTSKQKHILKKLIDEFSKDTNKLFTEFEKTINNIMS